jgi:hypothetical protein
VSPSGAPRSSPLRDVALIARFEWLRAIRTWQAVSLMTLYGVACSGATWLFTRVIGEMEDKVAEAMGVATTDTPGTLLNELATHEEFRRMIGFMIGDDTLVDAVIGWPALAIFFLWLGFGLLPFLASVASAETISQDLRTHTIRYEALRTGRLELVLGRFAGQALLCALATVVGAIATFTVAMTQMVGNDPVALANGLAALGVRAWAFSLPFVGVGIGCSQLTATPAWARVLAIATTFGSWLALGLAYWLEEDDTWWWVAAILFQALPQGWMRGFWAPGLDWLAAAVPCAAFGLAAMSVGYLRFAGRDL